MPCQMKSERLSKVIAHITNINQPNSVQISFSGKVFLLVKKLGVGESTVTANIIHPTAPTKLSPFIKLA